jgi:hypothetical protein
MYSFAVRDDHRSVTPLDNRVPIPDGVAEVMTRAPAGAIDKRELSIARGAEKTCPDDGSELAASQ